MKHKLKFLLCILSVSCGFYGCKKRPFNYRNDMVGTYQLLNRTIEALEGGGYVFVYTESCTAEVYYQGGGSDLIIEPDGCQEAAVVTLDKDGTTITSDHYAYSGVFRNDTIFLSYSYGGSPGNPAGVTSGSMYGVKIE